jgi:hypothetical protein
VGPSTRRRVALVHLVASVVVGWPLSWWLPTVPEPWFGRVLLAISFYAITVTAADVLATTDAREQLEGGDTDAAPVD